MIDGFHSWNSSHCHFHRAWHYSLPGFWLKQLPRGRIVLNRWLSSQSDPTSQGTFGNVWRHFCLSQSGRAFWVQLVPKLVLALAFSLAPTGIPMHVSSVAVHWLCIESLFRPFDGSLISRISLLNFWLVCCLLQVGPQTQTRRAVGFRCSCLTKFAVMCCCLLPEIKPTRFGSKAAAFLASSALLICWAQVKMGNGPNTEITDSCWRDSSFS